MPCFDVEESRTRGEFAKHQAEKAKVEAMLCAVLGQVRKEQDLVPFMNKIDWVAAGITKADLTVWWINHQQKDLLSKM